MIPVTPCAGSGSPRTRKTATTTAWPTQGCGRCATWSSPGRSSIRDTGRSIARSTNSSPRPCWKKPATKRPSCSSRITISALLPRMLKESNANLIVAQFWHIPWPSPEVFQTFPWKEELLDGLAGQRFARFSSALPLQELPRHRGSHPGSQGRLRALRDHPRRQGDRGAAVPDQHRCRRSRGHGQAVPQWSGNGALAAAAGSRPNEMLGIGIDRIDYTKGIPERLRASICFWKSIPNTASGWCSCRSACRAARTSRSTSSLDDEIDSLVEQINWRWSTDSWRPIIYLKQQHVQSQMMALHRLADFCVVSSLDDGMNLVAKEFVASRFDGDGV